MSVGRILKYFKSEVYIPRLLRPITRDSPDPKMDYCEYFEINFQDQSFCTEH